MSWLSWLRGFFKTDYEDPPSWRPERDDGGLDQITVGYHVHDYEGPGWWLGVGEVPVVRALEWGPYQTKEEAVEAAQEKVGDEGEINFWATTWRITSPDEGGETWSISPDVEQRPESKEEALSLVLDSCESEDKIVLKESGETNGHSVEEAWDLVD